MISIRCQTTVDEIRRAVVQLPSDVALGTHEIIVVIDEKDSKERSEQMMAIPTMSVGTWPANLSLRRDDLYDDNGR